MTTLPVSDAYRGAIWVSVLLQAGLTLFLGTLLDAGVLARMAACAMVGFWIGAAIIMVRRPRNPTTLDLIYIRWGYVPMLLLGGACAGIVERLVG